MIAVDASVVWTGEGHPATLTCRVKAEPVATVAWYKNTMLIDHSANHRYRLHAHADVHSLVVRQVGIEDLANYTCMAVNSMGKEEANIELSGKQRQNTFKTLIQFLF